jgi:hypothetical protein
MDDLPPEKVERIRSDLNLDVTNSMLCTSESPDSYHLPFPIVYRDKPPTIRCLKEILRGIAKHYGIEVYPQANRGIRLPFGPYQKLLDYEYQNLNQWEDKFFWFQKLDPVDLANIPYHQMKFENLVIPQRVMRPIEKAGDAIYLLKCGLQSPSTRAEAQFKILYYFWRQNIPIEQAIAETWKWINKHHNGYSKDILRYPKQVKDHIIRQARSIYDRYELSYVYPDQVHNSQNGYIAKGDIKEILMATDGNLPRAKFLFNLVKYYYPKRYRLFVGIHTEKLIGWSNERTYLKYINEFEEKGILKRGQKYLVGEFSKNLKLNWPFKNADQAVLFEGRALDTFENTVRVLHEPAEFKAILANTAVQRTTIIKAVNRIYKDGQREEIEPLGV